MSYGAQTETYEEQRGRHVRYSSSSHYDARLPDNLRDSECTAVRATTLKRGEVNVEEKGNNSGRKKKEYKGKKGMNGDGGRIWWRNRNGVRGNTRGIKGTRKEGKEDELKGEKKMEKRGRKNRI